MLLNLSLGTQPQFPLPRCLPALQQHAWTRPIIQYEGSYRVFLEKSHGKMVNAGMVKGTSKKCYTRKGVTHSGEIEETSALVRPVGPMSFLVTTFGSIITKARPKELQMHCQNTLRKASLLVISIPLHQVLVCGTHVLHQLRQAIQQPSSSDRINEAYHAYMELSGSIMRL